MAKRKKEDEEADPSIEVPKKDKVVPSKTSPFTNHTCNSKS